MEDGARLAGLGCVCAERIEPAFLGRSVQAKAECRPAPGVLWEPRQPLPQIAQPESTPLPSSAAAFTLAELTEYALRNNPRARQAWFGARAAAAGVGIEQADMLPQITGLVTAQRVRPVSATTGAASPWQNSLRADDEPELHPVRFRCSRGPGGSRRISAAGRKPQPEPRAPGHCVSGGAGVLPAARPGSSRASERAQSSEPAHIARCGAATARIGPCDGGRCVSGRNAGCSGRGQPHPQPGRVRESARAARRGGGFAGESGRCVCRRSPSFRRFGRCPSRSPRCSIARGDASGSRGGGSAGACRKGDGESRHRKRVCRHRDRRRRRSHVFSAPG